MRKAKKILNGIMGICLGYYVGHCIFVLWNHYRHPEFYAMQSAPWYTSLWVDGLIVLAAVLGVIYFIITGHFLTKKLNLE